MLYPKNLEKKLGFDQIRTLLKEKCLSSLGASFVNKIRFSSDYQLVKKLLEQTEEFRQILISGESFPSSGYLDVSESLEKIKVEGTFLNEEEFFNLKLSLSTIFSCLLFFKQHQEDYPNLAAVSCSVVLEKDIVKLIDAKIDEKGKLRNNATPELQRIRTQIQSSQVHLRRMLDKMIRQSKSNGMTPEDMSLTVRDGRMVIPVNASHKRQIKGFIHDESSTGQTVFIEPAEALEVNNEIRELEYRERREIIRILTELTDHIRPETDVLKRAYHFLGMVDYIRAKAQFALDTEAEMPELVKNKEIEWWVAKHPLLLLAHKRLNKPVVPLHIRFSPKNRIILVSGPNAGGKSVTLKTVGLIQYMMQCGLLPPMMAHSKVGLFRSIFIDIGDEQSIENDLSTYSSHLTNMKHFTNFADKHTLFLIDEFGTGTEPQFGGAIAEAILDKLNQLKAFGVINTHYANLKKFAENHHGLINGAMRFDMDKLEPIYELEIGKPGSSFALEIAQKIGLPKEVLQEAKQKVGHSHVRFDRLVGELEHEKRKLKKETEKAEKRDLRLKSVVQEYEELKTFVEEKRKTLINEAKLEAKRIVEEANQQVEKTIRVIKERKAEKEATKKAREKLQSFKEKIKPEKVSVPQSSEEVQVVGGEITVGSSVRIKGQETIGEVTALRGKDVEVRFGALSSKMKANRLEKVSRKERRKAERGSAAHSFKGFNINAKMANFNPKLDVRGKRVEEVFQILINFIDEASMLGIPEVQIVHGKGSGALKDFIRAELKGYPQVKSFADEHADRGGAGITVVKMK
ncbi:MAG: Smr/MutS family protein [Cytophagales bacterium]|nr:Smr/MutS family protein [Cytophagales bacterium]